MSLNKNSSELDLLEAIRVSIKVYACDEEWITQIVLNEKTDSFSVNPWGSGFFQDVRSGSLRIPPKASRSQETLMNQMLNEMYSIDYAIFFVIHTLIVCKWDRNPSNAKKIYIYLIRLIWILGRSIHKTPARNYNRAFSTKYTLSLSLNEI